MVSGKNFISNIFHTPAAGYTLFCQWTYSLFQVHGERFWIKEFTDMGEFWEGFLIWFFFMHDEGGRNALHFGDFRLNVVRSDEMSVILLRFHSNAGIQLARGIQVDLFQRGP